jgi:hypothetical protein
LTLVSKTPFVVLCSVLLSWSCTGNHPEAGACSEERPYYGVCTAGSHDLLGWAGPCRTTRADAQHDADEHARTAHDGNAQWIGVGRVNRYSGYGRDGLQP